MRPQTWIAILALLVFGVGYTLGIITVRIADGSTETRREDRRGSRSRWERGERGERPDRGERGGRRGGRSGSFGSYLGSLQTFADELGLTDGQRSELETLIADTTEAIARHEQGISNLVLETRRKIDEILTDEQRERLDRLIHERMRAYGLQRLESMTEWFRQEVELDEGALAQVRAILEEHHEAKGQYFGECRKKESWPERKEMESNLDSLTKERDRKLVEIVSEQDLDRFRREWSHRRRGR